MYFRQSRLLLTLRFSAFGDLISPPTISAINFEKLRCKALHDPKDIATRSLSLGLNPANELLYGQRMRLHC